MITLCGAISEGSFIYSLFLSGCKQQFLCLIEIHNSKKASVVDYQLLILSGKKKKSAE